MAAPIRTDYQITQDREIVARLSLKGWDQQKIADHLSQRREYEVSKAMIQYDQDAIRTAWREHRDQIIDEHINRELAKINEVEREAWESWDATGEARFLSMLLNCSTERRKLLGLDKPTRSSHEFSGPDPAAIIAAMEADISAREAANA